LPLLALEAERESPPDLLAGTFATRGAARGLLHADTTIYPLKDAVAAYDDLTHGRVVGRAVVVPNDTFTP
jgi:hypothetical protein